MRHLRERALESMCRVCRKASAPHVRAWKCGVTLRQKAKHSGQSCAPSRTVRLDTRHMIHRSLSQEVRRLEAEHASSLQSAAAQHEEQLKLAKEERSALIASFESELQDKTWVSCAPRSFYLLDTGPQ